MPYQISNTRLWVRDIGAPRMDFVIGKGVSLFPDWMRINVEAELQLTDSSGATAIGCSADWPSFGWLDKRHEVAPQQKLIELLELLETVRRLQPAASWDTPFSAWWDWHRSAATDSRTREAVPLCVAFATALWERALLDAFCRLKGLSFFQAVRESHLGLELQRIHPELEGFAWRDHLPRKPAPAMHVRHTVGPLDPLTAADVGSQRPSDDLPHTLEQYVQQLGVTHFKIKIGGQPAADLQRLQCIWSVIGGVAPVITLDGNEAYDHVGQVSELLDRLALESPQLLRHIRFIEQPANRAATLQATPDEVAAVARRVPLVIDEADGYLHAFRDAVALGYQGVSHKNCKGVIKSLANFAFCHYHGRPQRPLFQTAEDLTNLPIVALHQDLVVAGTLGLQDAERNGHHFFGGLDHLSESERSDLSEAYPGLYTSRDNGQRLRIVDGQLDVHSLHRLPGLGLRQPPVNPQRHPMDSWLTAFASQWRSPSDNHSGR